MVWVWYSWPCVTRLLAGRFFSSARGPRHSRAWVSRAATLQRIIRDCAQLSHFLFWLLFSPSYSVCSKFNVLRMHSLVWLNILSHRDIKVSYALNTPWIGYDDTGTQAIFFLRSQDTSVFNTHFILDPLVLKTSSSRLKPVWSNTDNYLLKTETVYVGDLKAFTPDRYVT